MNVKVRFALPAGEIGDYLCSIPEEDWRRMQAFRCYAEELSATRLLSSPTWLDFGVRWTEGQGEVAFEGRAVPTDDDLRAFLLLMRPFVLSGEPTYYPRIRNLLFRQLRHTGCASLFKDQMALFNGERVAGSFCFVSDGVPLHSDEMLMKWLNGYEYHRDADKRKEIEQHHDVIPLPFSRSVWTLMMLLKARAVIELAGWIMAIEKGGVCQPIAEGIADSTKHSSSN